MSISKREALRLLFVMPFMKQLKLKTENDSGVITLDQPKNFVWYLSDDYKYIVELNGEKITFTARDIFEALKQ